ncbi:MAG: hypothetical protein C3F06_08575 [Candidatus Methanoperedenaceae archaeon]|nr:MAG: hypothetical protein C3F06_08575 [Candidatus Methanoperedenaceae archaeon]
MKRIIEKSKNLFLIAVASTLIASIIGFLWGLTKTFTVIINLILSYGKNPFAAIELIELMDIFLIATILYIFALGMYELFIGSVNLPDWLIIRNLHDLKVKLSSVIILVMCITFLKHLVEWRDPQGTLFFGLAIAVVTVSLIAFGYFGGED